MSWELVAAGTFQVEFILWESFAQEVATTFFAPHLTLQNVSMGIEFY